MEFSQLVAPDRTYTWDEFRLLLVILASQDYPAFSPGGNGDLVITRLKDMAAYKWADDMADMDREDRANLAMNGLEGIDQDELVDGVPIRLRELWEYEPSTIPYFIDWAINNWLDTGAPE